MIRKEGDNFIFEVRCDGASEVFLAGDFNRWMIPGKPMVQTEPGRWQTHGRLPAGMQRVGYFALSPRLNQSGPLSHLEAHFDARWLSVYDCVHVEQHESEPAVVDP